MSDSVQTINNAERSSKWTAVYILTAALILCAFICDSKIFQLFSDGVFGTVPNSGSLIPGYLFNNIHIKIPCLLLVLYVFIFRKKAFGSLVFPVIYTIKLVTSIRAVVSDIAFTVEYADMGFKAEHFGGLSGSTIEFLVIDIIMACACAVLIFCSIKGFPKKPLLIVMTALLCIPNLYGVASYIVLTATADYSFFTVLIGTCDYLLPVLMFVTMMVIGLRKDYPSVADAFKRTNTAEPVQNKNRKLERALREYEGDLEDLKIQLESGVISQKNYDEMVADINADMDELRNKYQK